MKLKTKVLRTSLACLILATIGCGGDLVSVTGTVTVGGSDPLENGMIRFTPKDGSKQLTSAFAKIDDNGKYVLIHQSNRKGIPPGDYHVSFSLIKMPDGSPLPDQEGEAEPKSSLELGGIEFVPREYSDFKSGKNLTTVPKSGGKFDFDIPALRKPGEEPPAAAPTGGRRKRRDDE